MPQYFFLHFQDVCAQRGGTLRFDERIAQEKYHAILIKLIKIR